MDALARQRGRLAWWTAAICLLCTIPYWRALALPAISDTYLQVWLGRKYLLILSWPELAADALYRCRATSIWLTGITDYLFGPNQFVLNFQSLALHGFIAVLIARLGAYPHIGYRISLPAALLWGWNERHHEAVMWYASLPEQLVFFFILLTLLGWLAWWQSGHTWLYAAALVSFLLALLSKESAVITCALLGIPLFFEPKRWQRVLVGASPFIAIGCLYFALNQAAKDTHLHWNDGTFRLGWHFLPVMFRSALRLFSVFGFAALLWLWWKRKELNWPLAMLALLWIPVALAPYSFVAYQPRVPSRHAYIASLGVAILLALALDQLRERRRWWLGLLLVYLLFNTGYLWFYKHSQFLDRAQVTEQVVQDARALTATYGLRPLQVTCFPLGPELASLAIQEHLGIPESQVAVQYSSNPNCGPTQVLPILD